MIRNRFACGLLAIGLLLPVQILVEMPRQVRADPPCMNDIHFPQVDPALMCQELIIRGLSSQGIASVSAISFNSMDGDLYVARPATKQILRYQPDGKGFFQPPEVFADHLPEPPNGMEVSFAASEMIVSGDTMVWSFLIPGSLSRPERNATFVNGNPPQIVIRNLPGGAGGWLGNVHIYQGYTLYVTKGASCDACIESDPRRGTLLSFNAGDGRDMKIIAHGLRDPYDFTWSGAADDTLYILDNERANFPAKLNALTREESWNGNIDFGWPRCDPAGNPVAGIEGATPAYCATTRRPIATFDAGSHPTAMIFYRSDTLPSLKDKLLVGLSGSWNNTTTAGYEIHALTVNGMKVINDERVIPYSDRSTSDASLYETSFFPYHISSFAISPEGWLYVATIEGAIFRFRPRV